MDLLQSNRFLEKYMNLPALNLNKQTNKKLCQFTHSIDYWWGFRFLNLHIFFCKPYSIYFLMGCLHFPKCVKALDSNMLRILPLCQTYCKHFPEFVICFLNFVCGIFFFDKVLKLKGLVWFRIGFGCKQLKSQLLAQRGTDLSWATGSLRVDCTGLTQWLHEAPKNPALSSFLLHHSAGCCGAHACCLVVAR